MYRHTKCIKYFINYLQIKTVLNPVPRGIAFKGESKKGQVRNKEQVNAGHKTAAPELRHQPAENGDNQQHAYKCCGI